MRWAVVIAILLCFTTELSAKKIVPIRPEARRRILSLDKIANSQILKKVR